MGKSINPWRATKLVAFSEKCRKVRVQEFAIAIESKKYFHVRFCSSQILQVHIDIGLATVGFQPAGPYLTATEYPIFISCLHR